MKSDNLDIKEFLANTEDMGRDERYIAAQRELREADKLPYHRRKGATKTRDRKIEQYMLDLKSPSLTDYVSDDTFETWTKSQLPQ
jgi:hypothetical protein